ncbi:hypothetical protein MNBD_UNCLBAC01-1851 [hydrothermal vent metagenome]|uniref:Uncharacterized protein n=1 Tax=hydrothermal vent metagenome TaxID=652676 RepID=A0A3B1DDN1_9ZZZZ
MFKLIRTIIFLGIIVIAVLAFKNVIIKSVVEKGVESATGLPLKIGSFNLGLTKTHIGIKEFQLFNPEGFPDEAMFTAPEVFVDYNLGNIIKGKIHLEEIRLNFDKLVVIKNANGELNLNVLKPKKKESDDQKSQPDSEEKKETKKKGKAPDIQIDHLLLKVGKVVYKDYSKGGEPSVKEFEVNLYEKFDNITNPEMLMTLIVQKVLAKTALSNLLNFDMQGSIDSVKEKMDSFKGKIKLPFNN